MRNMIIYELEADYAHYLEALGAPRSLIRRYTFRNAMLPQITGLALQLGVVLGGALVTEIVFSYPGLGYLTLRALKNRDLFLLQGTFLFIMVGVLVANFLIDLLYMVVDPRTRVGMQGDVGVIDPEPHRSTPTFAGAGPRSRGRRRPRHRRRPGVPTRPGASSPTSHCATRS